MHRAHGLECSVTWTRTPPAGPGRYGCRFLPSPAIGREPLAIELVEDTIDGGLMAPDRHGMCHRLEVAHRECEWSDLCN